MKNFSTCSLALIALNCLKKKRLVLPIGLHKFKKPAGLVQGNLTFYHAYRKIYDWQQKIIALFPLPCQNLF